MSLSSVPAPARPARPSVLVLGAGYGGALCAARLAGRGHAVTVVDPAPSFQHRVRFHERAAGVRLPAPALGPWLQVPHRQARAVAVRPGAVELHTGEVLRADRIVIAVGRSFGGPPGCDSLASPAAAGRVAAAVQSGAAVRILGAGLTGVELAGALAPLARVTLVDRGALDAFSPDTRALLGRWLAEAGVVHHTHARGPAAARSGERLLWAGGTRARPLEVEGARLGADGRLLVDAHLQVVPGVFAVGDVAHLPHQPWHGGGCALALPMGAHVADHISRGPQAPFSYRWTARLVAFGRRALLQGTDARGRPTRCLAAGRLAGLAKQALLASTLWTIRAERRTGLGLFRWPRPAPALVGPPAQA